MTAAISHKQRIQRDLAAFDFRTLFVEERGWDILREAPLAIVVDEQMFTLRSLVEKCSFFPLSGILYREANLRLSMALFFTCHI